MSGHKNNTENFYREIIQKVCENVQEYFLNEGVGEETLCDLKKIWNEKLVQSGIFQPKSPTFLNYQIDAKQACLLRYRQNYDLEVIKTKNYMVHGTPGFTNGLTQLIPVNQFNRKCNETSQIEFRSDPNKTTIDNVNIYLQKKNIQLTTATQPIQVTQPPDTESVVITSTQLPTTNVKLEEEEPEYDSDLEVFEKVDAKKEGSEKKENAEEDEELSDISNYSECLEPDTKDFLLAQYEKVHRVHAKWKCTFKDAILHINGKEYVFEKVVGELERDW